ncbi:MAG: adenine phosphoribosyltransferase [Candidatus Dormibacteria bacterium]
MAEALTELDLRAYVRDVPDFPKPGILFRDLTPMLGDGAAFRQACALLAQPFSELGVAAVAGIESRGFTFGAVVAFMLGVGIVPVRKAGKLPAEVISARYQLEYGEAVLEIHRDAIPPGTRVLVIDDLLATGGTAAATLNLIRRVGGEPVGMGVVVELLQLGGRAKLQGERVVALLPL